MWQTTTDIILMKSEKPFDDNISMDGPSDEAPDEYYEKNMPECSKVKLKW